MRRSRGGALIIAMLVVALVTASAAMLLRGQSLAAAQTETLLTLGQGRRLLAGGLDWAMAILADDARSNAVDHLQETWARPMPVTVSDGWEFQGRIEDAQSRFNLNNLLRDGQPSAPDIEIFERILQQIGAPSELSNALLDWMDADNEVRRPGGAEDGDYLNGQPPYRSANRALAEMGNLTRVRGFTPAIIDKLRSFATVLPERTTINVNTVSPELLMLLVPGLSAGEARTLVSGRVSKPFTTLVELRALLPRAELRLAESGLSTGTRYFLVTGQARHDEIKMSMTALVLRPGPFIRPSVVWRRE